MRTFTGISCVLIFAISISSLCSMLRQRCRLDPPSNASVGFSLAPDYGTVSCRRPDGTVRDIARISGSHQYLDLMKRLSLRQSEHPHKPHLTLEDLWEDSPRQWLRSFRKALGLAASSDVQIIGIPLNQLRQRAEEYLSELIEATVISYPVVNALYAEDIRDAARYARMSSLSGYRQPQESVAAYAGHGMGLCEHFNDKERRRSEGLAMPSREVLSIQCTDTATLLHLRPIREAQNVYRFMPYALAIFDDDQNDGGSVSTAVKSVISKAYSREERGKLTVIASGESAAGRSLQKTSKHAIESFGLEVQMLASDPLYIAARGAAVIAFRERAATGEINAE